MVVTMLALANGGDQNKLTPGLLYFLGRVDGREPTLDLDSALRREVGAMSPNAIRSEVARCMGELQRRGAAIQALARSLRPRK